MKINPELFSKFAYFSGINEAMGNKIYHRIEQMNKCVDIVDWNSNWKKITSTWRGKNRYVLQLLAGL